MQISLWMQSGRKHQIQMNQCQSTSQMSGTFPYDTRWDWRGMRWIYTKTSRFWEYVFGYIDASYKHLWEKCSTLRAVEEYIIPHNKYHRLYSCRRLRVVKHYVWSYDGDDIFYMDYILSLPFVSFLHDRPWISPWIKTIFNELNITIHVIASQLFDHCDVISSRLWRHQHNENRASQTR